MSLLEFSVDRRVDHPGYRDLGRGHLSLRDYESFEVVMTCAVDGWQGATELREHMERYFASMPPALTQREHLNQLSEMDELRERLRESTADRHLLRAELKRLREALEAATARALPVHFCGPLSGLLEEVGARTDLPHAILATPTTAIVEAREECDEEEPILFEKNPPPPPETWSNYIQVPVTVDYVSTPVTFADPVVGRAR